MDMGGINRGYYGKKGKRIYSDFKTYAHSGKMLASANAKEFCEKYANAQQEVLVAEFGVGNGKFANDFLDEVKKKDGGLYGRTNYALFDFSEKMLSDAKKTLGAHLDKCEFLQFDAAKDKMPAEFAGKISYARMNELLTDLPCEFYAIENGEIVEAEFDRKGKFSQFVGAEGERSMVAGDFLARVGENYIIPFNFAACEFVHELGGAIAQSGALDVFDYGFAGANDVLCVPADMWNMNVVREFGGQLTTDLNIPLLCAFAKSAGLDAQSEGQKEYVERVLGKKVGIGETKYSKASKEIGESDMFFHVRLSK